MAVPALQVYVQGQGTVSADNYNTFVSGCNYATDLQSFIGISGIQVYMRGLTAIADGGQGNFYWNSTGTANDGINNIQPNGVAVGCWTRIPSINNNYTYNAAASGFSITVAFGITSVILNPSGTLATGTVITPANPIDGQTLSITSSQNITSFTFTSNSGQTIKNAPTSLTGGTGVNFQYVLSIKTWFRLY